MQLQHHDHAINTACRTLSAILRHILIRRTFAENTDAPRRFPSFVRTPQKVYQSETGRTVLPLWRSLLFDGLTSGAQKYR